MSSTQKRALVVAHDPSGGAAVLGRALSDRGWLLHEHVVNPDLDRPEVVDPLPAIDGNDLLVVMGSAHSVYDRTAVGAWIDEELELIRSAHRRGVPVLGVCFGAQALALALGGSVEASPITEIGWYRIRSEVDGEIQSEVDGEGGALPIGHGPWFQWHHDRLTPPTGADVLASTPENIQLFRLGRSVGTQFHPEIDTGHLARWLRLAPDPYLERWGVDTEGLLAETKRLESTSELACNGLVDWFLATSASC